MCRREGYRAEIDGPPLHIEFYNHTGGGFAGYHYDPLFTGDPPPERDASAAGASSSAPKNGSAGKLTAA